MARETKYNYFKVIQEYWGSWCDSELFLYNVGYKILGKEKSSSVDSKVVMVTGLISCMGNEYVRVSKIDCDNVDLNFRDKIISFFKNNELIDKIIITTEDIANPSKWLDNLYKKFICNDHIKIK